MENKITAGTISRTVVLGLALLNQILLLCGVQAIPIADEDINTIVSTAWTVVASLVAWWENNSFTPAARVGDEAMRRHRESADYMMRQAVIRLPLFPDRRKRNVF